MVKGSLSYNGSLCKFGSLALGGSLSSAGSLLLFGSLHGVVRSEDVGHLAAWLTLEEWVSLLLGLAQCCWVTHVVGSLVHNGSLRGLVRFLSMGRSMFLARSHPMGLSGHRLTQGEWVT
jgi:hypothetical protein